MAPPEMVEDYPVFRWPKDNREVKAMMQSNDVFIQVNIITDIIIAYFPTKGIRLKGFGSACFFPKMVVSLSICSFHVHWRHTPFEFFKQHADNFNIHPSLTLQRMTSLYPPFKRKFTAKHYQVVAILMKTGLNHVVRPTLFTVVNNIEQYCYTRFRLNNIVQYCRQV
jgi:hypothetical protein